MVVLEVVVPGSWFESEDRASGVDEAVATLEKLVVGSVAEVRRRYG